MKPATNRLAGPLLEFGGRGELLQDPLLHDRDPVGERDRLGLVVGHEDRGHLPLISQSLIRARSTARSCGSSCDIGSSSR